jgi:amidase
MPIANPTAAEIRRLAESMSLALGAGEAETYAEIVSGTLAGLAVVDSLPDDPPELRYSRSAGAVPPAGENPLGAWAVRTRIEGATSGPLDGKTVALKDNVLLAGVPLANGTSVLEGYVPREDATVVTRLLDAGATILGKAVCEGYCFSGGSHTSASGPVRNPHDPARSAGGSSSGSAALVAAGEVDLAIGCDQGGSIRMPSSFCGTVGMKPTHGLVPYTGILSMDPTYDHAGPITREVADNARMLEVLAGPDGLDTRQQAVRTERYSEALGRGAEGLRIGVLREGFGQETSEPDVDAKVRAAAQRFEKLGAELREVSVPLHTAGAAIAFAVLQTAMDFMFHADGLPLGRQDPVDPGFLEAQSRWRERSAELPPTVKSVLLQAAWLREQAGYRYVARAVNQIRTLRAAYDAALDSHDLLLLPTTPMKAMPLPSEDAGPQEVIASAFAPLPNTMPFDHSHHPALAVPCGMSEGLPVSMMLVGRHWEEAVLYRAANAFEGHQDWRTL